MAARNTSVTESPHLLLDPAMFIFQLAKDLYPTYIAALWELVRNGAIAGMPEDAESWVHSRAARVEIVVIPETDGTSTLYLCDTGAGLTEENRKRMMHAGGDMTATERAGGASKRKIGRLASIALNSAFDVSQEELKRVKADEGMTYYSRTKEDVRLGRNASRLDINMRCFIQNIAFEYTPHCIPLNDPRLGPFKNRSGSFTVLVIPNFKMTAEQIIQELPYFLPRKADRQIYVSVNGTQVKGPIVDTRRGYVSENGTFEIYLGLKNPDSKVQHEAEGEIVICDADSACAVATIRSSATNALQSYLRDERLCGVVFYPNLFGRTNTGRTSLNPLYWIKGEGRRFANYLNSTETRSLVSAVLGTDVRPDGDTKSREFDGVLRQLENAFGPAIDLNAKKKRKTTEGDNTPKQRDPSERNNDRTDHPEDEPDDDPSEGTTRKQKDPLLVLPIGDKRYLLMMEPNERSSQVARQPVDELQRTVTIHEEHYSVICVNPDWKGSREISQAQRTNYMILEILRVAAEYVCPRSNVTMRDETRTRYYVDVCNGAWKSRQTQS